MIHLCQLKEIFPTLELAIMITAAVCHDLDHPGYNNKWVSMIQYGVLPSILKACRLNIPSLVRSPLMWVWEEYKRGEGGEGGRRRVEGACAHSASMIRYTLCRSYTLVIGVLPTNFRRNQGDIILIMQLLLRTNMHVVFVDMHNALCPWQCVGEECMP